MEHVPGELRDEWSVIFQGALQQLLSTPTEDSLTYLFLTTKALLGTMKHGGKGRTEAVSRTLRGRFLLWKTGNISELWQHLLDEHKTTRRRTPQSEEQVHHREAHRIARLVDRGQISRAASQLTSRGLASNSESTLDRLRHLFPAARDEHESAGAAAVTFIAEPDDVKAVMVATPAGRSPGCSGLRAEHLRDILSDRNRGTAAGALDILTKFVNISLGGYLPPELQAYLCGGRLIPLIKKDGGVRPLVVGETLRALVSKVALKFLGNSVDALQPLQVGVGGKGPVIQAAVVTAKSWVNSLKDDEILLKVDLSNAYNTIARSACLRGIAQYCPDLSRWAAWCLCGTSKVFYGDHIIPCATGVQQGDPLAPLLFSVGLHTVIYQADALAGVTQIWYMDDGLLKGPRREIAQHLARIQHKLANIGLCINKTKCEIYGPATSSPIIGLEGVPVIQDRDGWTYLGIPLCEQTVRALQAVRSRVSQSTASIARFANTHPSQALQVLRATSGACKVEFMIQSLTPSHLVEDLASFCAEGLRTSFTAVLKVPAVDGSTWTTATLPLRMGGLGLRDPTVITASARLASLVNVSEHALAFGACHEHITRELDLASTRYMMALGMVVCPQLKPSADLQRLLTDPFHQRALDRLVRVADEPTLQRLNSLTTPHATAWTTTSPIIASMSPVEFRAALRWILGLPFRSSSYTCPDCGRHADPLGLHAVTCSRSGMVTRGHTTLRDTVQEILRKAGLTVDAEQSIPGHSERPADLLVSSWHGRPLAVDFTIITPTRLSASHLSSVTTLMDQAAESKNKRSLALCESAGWSFSPFVADTFGAIRCDARAFITRVIKRHTSRFAPMTDTDVGAATWSAITSAVVARAAMQLGRLSIIDQPLGMNLNGLDLRRNRGPTSHTICGIKQEPSSTSSSSPPDMGTNVLAQPSPVETVQEEHDSFSLVDRQHSGRRFDVNTGFVVNVDETEGPTRQLSEHGLLLPSTKSFLPRLMRLPQGTVEPLRVSLPAVASNASLGLVDPPYPVTLLPEERYQPPSSSRPNPAEDDEVM